MKSEKVKELTKWLESRVRPIDLPRDYSSGEVSMLVEIAELEISGQLTKDVEKLEEKVKEFRERYW